MAWKRKVLWSGVATLGTASTIFIAQRQWDRFNRVTWSPQEQPPNFELPSREDQIARQKRSTSQTPYDILVIGGGATGTGVALDAATRGLHVALVERDDFASGTSSRSTKLVHGGVRYLEKAFRNLDKEQWDMVREALHERKNFLKIAPHLSYELPIMIPLYKWWHAPYYWAGAKVYDLLAGKNALQASYFISKTSALEHFPHLAKNSLKGAVVYHDGAHNDARMNVALALTALHCGAHVANHVEVVALLKNDQGIVCGATVRDMLTDETWDVHARSVVNATGPFSDAVRTMDEGPATEKIVCPSAGVHVILPDYYSPKHMGLLDAATSDGRVIFFLPWENSVIAGTTDSVTEVTPDPSAQEEDIQFILKEISSYLSPDIQVRRSDVLSAWSGIRPLVRDPTKASTEGLARNHLVFTSKSGLVTVAGGKWTTYRAMALDTVDAAVKSCNLQPKQPSQTEETLLIGAHAYNPTLKIKLIQEYGMESLLADHLARSYGDRAFLVAELARPTGQRWPVVGRRIATGYPYIEAEIVYAIRHEMARTLVDVLARRTRLAFLNATAASEAIPKIASIMEEELGWSKETRQKNVKEAYRFLKTMGYIHISNDDPAAQLSAYRETFKSLDVHSTGKITLAQYQQFLNATGIPYDPRRLNEWFEAAHLKQGEDVLAFNEFVELTELIKAKKIETRFGGLSKETNATLKEDHSAPSTERSGGGV